MRNSKISLKMGVGQQSEVMTAVDIKNRVWAMQYEAMMLIDIKEFR